MMKYRLAAFDLDGTLTNGKKEVTPRTREAIHRFIGAGGVAALASGRPTEGIQNVAEALSLTELGGYILSYNGGELHDCRTGELLFQKMLPPDAAECLDAFAKENGLSILSYHEGKILTENPDDEYTVLEQWINHMPVQKVTEFRTAIQFPIVKCLLTGKPERVGAAEQKLIALYGDRFTISCSTPYFLEVQAKGVDKGSTLMHLAELLQIRREETAAFGDGGNDLPMIRAAGLGVSMGNAEESLKQAADLVAPDNEHDGVAAVLETFLCEKGWVIFDMDGTLNRSERFALPSMRRALMELHAKGVTDEMILDSIGAKDEDSIRVFFGDRAEEVGAEFWKRTNQYAKEFYYQDMQAYDGILPLLKRLKEEGYQIAVCSNAQMDYIQNCIHYLGIGAYIDDVEETETGLRKIDTLARFLKRKGTKKAVMIGDRYYDRDAAASNGIPFIACLYGYGKEELSAEPLKAKDPSELYGLIRTVL